MMNADSSAQCNQKDFYNAYTQADQLPHSLTSSRAHTPSLQEIFDMNGLNMHSNSQNVGMDVLDNLMANTPSNSNDSSSMPAPAVTGPQPSQQALIEQQMKLNQLQQLYQLQTQIFQQQVSRPRVMIIHSSPKPSKPRTTGLMRRSTYPRSSC